jgi:hypothetical protein
MNLGPPVYAEDDTDVILVEKGAGFLIEEDTVGGQGEFEFLPPFGPLFPGIADHFLHHSHVQEGFAAKEVDLAQGAGAGIFQEKIYCPPAHLGTHQGPVAAVAPGIAKAVPAAKITVVGHVEAEGLHLAFPGPEVFGQGRGRAVKEALPAQLI